MRLGFWIQVLVFRVYGFGVRVESCGRYSTSCMTLSTLHPGNEEFAVVAEEYGFWVFF